MTEGQRSPSPARAAPDETVLKVALSAYVGIATVSKRGVRWKNGRYWSPALVAHMGRQVVMRRDEDDLGALFLFDGEENYIDTAVKILIAVVLGALLLAGLYALFGDVVMPTLNQRIKDMFNYAGALGG